MEDVVGDAARGLDGQAVHGAGGEAASVVNVSGVGDFPFCLKGQFVAELAQVIMKHAQLAVVNL